MAAVHHPEVLTSLRHYKQNAGFGPLKEGIMATRVTIETYRDLYLRPIEEKLLEHRGEIPHFTTPLLEDAIRTELTRANSQTWEIEVPDNKEVAMKEAESRILDFMSKNFDLGTGIGSVVKDKPSFSSGGGCGGCGGSYSF